MNPYMIVQPVISEKSLLLASKQNAYTFEVQRSATKKQIKGAVESLYEVEVLAVNTILGHKDTKRTGAKRLARPLPKIKKAIVTLKKGHKIELFDVQGVAEGEAK